MLWGAPPATRRAESGGVLGVAQVVTVRLDPAQGRGHAGPDFGGGGNWHAGASWLTVSTAPGVTEHRRGGLARRVAWRTKAVAGEAERWKKTP